MEELVGINIQSPIMQIKHADIKRAEDDSQYKSVCPQCNEGVLMMLRNPETFKLRNIDNCFLCGQRFEYTDILDNEYTTLEELR
jgi:DNA-directed RNA polymerase subunit RPC12/RpoP